MVSVIIVNYNTFDLTLKCLESVYKYTEQISFEVVLVDNASTDRPANDFKLHYPQIKLVKNTENVGFAKGNNIGIDHSSGDLILLLNSDAELLNNAILIASDLLDRHPEAGIVSGKLSFPDGSIQHNCQRFPSIKNELLQLTRIHKIWKPEARGQRLLGPYFRYDRVADVDWVWGAFMLFPKNILEFFPGMKLSDNFFYYEDVEWCYIVKKNGLKVFFDPEPSILHHQGKTTSNIKNFKKRRTLVNSRRAFMKMYYTNLYRIIWEILHYLHKRTIFRKH